MSLRYSFRHLFYGGKIHKERLYKVLTDLDNGGTGSVSIEDLTDAELVEATITYEGGTTATVYIVTQASNQDTTQQESEGS